MKNNILVLFVLFVSFMFAQEIKFKKGIVYIDGKECLKYDNDVNNVSFQNLDGDDIFAIQYLRPDGTQASLYTKVVFFEYRRELTSQNYIYAKKSLIERLLKSNVLDNCTIDGDKLETFIMKYDEKVEERLNQKSDKVIIINNNQEPRKSGVNINIGG